MNTKFIIGLAALVFPMIEAQYIPLQDTLDLTQYRKSEEDCKKSLNLDDDGKTSSSIMGAYLFRNEPPTDRNSKCVASCILEDTKMVYYDGEHYHIYNELDEIKFAPRDVEMKGRVLQTMRTCLSSVPFDPEKCEYGANLMTCLSGHYKRHMSEMQSQIDLYGAGL